MKGECACGKLQIEVPTPMAAALCHCTDCRKTGGGLAACNLVIPRSGVKVSGGDPKSFKKAGDSGQDVQRYFCGDCGSPLWANADKMLEVSFVRAGLFPPHEVPKPAMHIYGKNREHWEAPVGDASVHAAAPPPHYGDK